MTAKATRNHLQRDSARQRLVYDLVDDLTGRLVLTDEERRRLRGLLYAFFWEDVSVESLAASCEALG